MASSSFDVSGLSDLSSTSIDYGDVPPRAATAPSGRPGTSAGRPGTSAGRPGTSAGRPGTSVGYRPAAGRPPASAPPGGRGAQRDSSASFELSGSDLSGSIEIDYDGDARAAAPTAWGRPPPGPAPRSSNPPPRSSAAPPRRTAASSNPSSISLGSDDLGDLEIEHSGSSAGQPRGRAAPHSAAGRLSRPAPGFPPGAGAGSGSGFARREQAVEVLSLDGPKPKKTNITRAGLSQQPLRESTHTVTLSEAESLDLSASLDIEHSADLQMPPPRRVTPITGTPEAARLQQQRYFSDGGDSGNISMSGSIVFSGGESSTLEINHDRDQGVSASYDSSGGGGGYGGGGMPRPPSRRPGSAAPAAAGGGRRRSSSVSVSLSGSSIDITGGSGAGLSGEIVFDTSELSGELGGRPPSRRPPSAAPMGLRRDETPSISGSFTADESLLHSSDLAVTGDTASSPTAPTHRHAPAGASRLGVTSAGSTPTPASPLQPPFQQHHSLSHQQLRNLQQSDAATQRSARSSLPQSLGGLTAEAAFASGSSSRSRTIRSISGDGEGVGMRMGAGAGGSGSSDGGRGRGRRGSGSSNGDSSDGRGVGRVWMGVESLEDMMVMPGGAGMGGTTGESYDTYGSTVVDDSGDVSIMRQVTAKAAATGTASRRRASTSIELSSSILSEPKSPVAVGAGVTVSSEFLTSASRGRSRRAVDSGGGSSSSRRGDGNTSGGGSGSSSLYGISGSGHLRATSPPEAAKAGRGPHRHSSSSGISSISIQSHSTGNSDMRPPSRGKMMPPPQQTQPHAAMLSPDRRGDGQVGRGGSSNTRKGGLADEDSGSGSGSGLSISALRPGLRGASGAAGRSAARASDSGSLAPSSPLSALPDNGDNGVRGRDDARGRHSVQQRGGGSDSGSIRSSRSRRGDGARHGFGDLASEPSSGSGNNDKSGSISSSQGMQSVGGLQTWEMHRSGEEEEGEQRRVVAAAEDSEEDDPLAGLQVVRMGSSSSSSSSSGRENIMRFEDLGLAADVSAGAAASPFRGSVPAEDGDVEDDERYTPPESLATISADVDTDAGGSGADGLRGFVRELSLRRPGSSAHGSGSPEPWLQSSSRQRQTAEGAEEASVSSRSRKEGRGEAAASDATGASVGDAMATVARPPPLFVGRVPDPRVAAVGSPPLGGSSSLGAGSTVVEEEEDVLGGPRRSLRGPSGWHLPTVESEQSSPSLGRSHHRTAGVEEAASPDGPQDLSLSQSGPLGVSSPIAPAWATSSPDRLGGRGVGGPWVGRMTADSLQYSRDSDLSEEFIPSGQAMQRSLREQPVFRPLMPYNATPRISIAADNNTSSSSSPVPAFTVRGSSISAAASSPAATATADPHATAPAFLASASSPIHNDYPQSPQPPQHQVETLAPVSPAVAAAAAPPPPSRSFAATQTDVYTEVVDLDPIPRPGTVKLRTVGMQWGTLNEVSTQVSYDTASERLSEAAQPLAPDDVSTALPPHLRLQLQHHLAQQQQLYGPFTKRGAAAAAMGPPSLLQAGADALLGGVAPLSGIGPGFGILSLAFHSVKTAALLEQLERSLSSAAAAASLPPQLQQQQQGTAPYGYLHPYGMGTPMMVPGGGMPYSPYGMQTPPPPPFQQGWWPAGAAAASQPQQQQPQTSGQAAAAAYAAAAAAAAAATATSASGTGTEPGTATAGAAATPLQPVPPPLLQPSLSSPAQLSPRSPSMAGLTAAAAASTPRTSGGPPGGGAWATPPAVGIPGSGRSASPLPLTSPSRLRSVSTPAGALPAAAAAVTNSMLAQANSSVSGSGGAGGVGGTSGSLGGGTTSVPGSALPYGPAVTASHSAGDVSYRRVSTGSGMIPGPRGAPSTWSGAPHAAAAAGGGGAAAVHYPMSVASMRSASSLDYTADFCEEEEEEEQHHEYRGAAAAARREASGVIDEVDEEEEQEEEVEEDDIPEEEIEVEESIPEEEPAGGSGGGGGRGGSSDSADYSYSEDFEVESVAAPSRTASFMRRSSMAGSFSRGKLNTALSGTSFSGRSFMRRSSIRVPHLTPISASSEGGSREEEEEGGTPAAGRSLNRLGSIIKSSSGFKRTASISITMADDPLAPNQMARILPTAYNTTSGGGAPPGAAAAAGSGTSPTGRALSSGGAAGGSVSRRRNSASEAAAAAAATSTATAAASTAPGGQQQAQQQQEPGSGATHGSPAPPPAGAYPPGYYYPYPPYPPYPAPYPYGLTPPPYGMPYPPPPPPPMQPTAAATPANVASVLQYLPPPIPVPSSMYFYPPQAHPPVAAPSAGAEGPSSAAAATPAAAAAAHAALHGGAFATAAGPYPHPHHHVTFADGTAPHSSSGAAASMPGGKGPNPTGAAAAAATPSFPPSAGPGAWSAPAAVPGHASAGLAHGPPHVPPAVGGYGGGMGVPLPPGYAGLSLGLGGGGFGLGSTPLFSAQSTLQRFGSVLSSGAFPGLDPATVRSIRSDLVKTAAAVSGQIGYEDIVAEAGAADEYRAQLARVRARLAAARASLPSVVPSQDKVVLLRTTAVSVQSAVAVAAAGGQQAQVAGVSSSTAGGSRILGVSTPAPGSYRYTTLEDTRRLIEATRPYSVVGVS
ncbi:hypothetical protein Agub_g6945 [Astrephomene gubernaculifera]|uniref:Uncharacterized protein n=1 Tax=Astrephomene gubernaculifera TaxID=47775 RepID=A0AAD3DPA3_9CHLO|nr:hypothetical protein Agub_g6945 [Astrephomene gubernaculifera]